MATRKNPEKHPLLPKVWAVGVAAFGLLALLLVNHGAWNKPKLQTEKAAYHSTTGASAQAVGATVTPTAPKPEIEPKPPGPKPVAPAIPDER
jgi:hypothetical protein